MMTPFPTAISILCFSNNESLDFLSKVSRDKINLRCNCGTSVAYTHHSKTYPFLQFDSHGFDFSLKKINFVFELLFLLSRQNIFARRMIGKLLSRIHHHDFELFPTISILDYLSLVVSLYDVSASFRLLLISSVSIANDELLRVKDAAINASIDNALIRIIRIWSNLFCYYLGFYRFLIAHKEKNSNLRGLMLTKRIFKMHEFQV